LCLAYGRHGIVCLGEIYGGTAAFLQQQAAPLGIHSAFLAGHDLAGLEKALQQGVSLVFFETPANPTLKVIDIRAITELARHYGAKVAVDNTFATPVNQQVLALGADFSVQSATKYLGGHSDLTAGVLSGRQDDIIRLHEWRKNLGQTLSPEVAHKLKRSLVTLPLRVEKHNQNAQVVAEYLAQHPAVDHVYYPGLPEDPGYQLASRQMSGFGGMLSFDVKGGEAQARLVIDSLKLISLAPSLGGAETLATQPVTSSHHGLSDSVLAQLGISGAMIRLSVGLEAVPDLIADLEQALQQAI
jgi:cystathionine beta-lyase/cystathionine gamma-synthase